jgi:hypothetical protein
LEFFDKEQICTIISEDFFADPKKELWEITHFLDLNDKSWMPEKLPRKQFHGSYPPMGSAIREHLVNYFKPYNKALYEVLEIELDWDK